MKYNLSKIMKRAWEIKRTTTNIFSICLKKSWAEAKQPAYLTGEALYARLVDMGASRWHKGGHDRIYFNHLGEKMLHLWFRCYKSGNIAEAKLSDERISNAEAGRILVWLSSLYLDAATGSLKWYGRCPSESYISTIRNTISTIAA